MAKIMFVKYSKIGNCHRLIGRDFVSTNRPIWTSVTKSTSVTIFSNTSLKLGPYFFIIYHKPARYSAWHCYRPIGRLQSKGEMLFSTSRPGKANEIYKYTKFGADRLRNGASTWWWNITVCDFLLPPFFRFLGQLAGRNFGPICSLNGSKDVFRLIHVPFQGLVPLNSEEFISRDGGSTGSVLFKMAGAAILKLEKLLQFLYCLTVLWVSQFSRDRDEAEAALRGRGKAVRKSLKKVKSSFWNLYSWSESYYLYIGKAFSAPLC